MLYKDTAQNQQHWNLKGEFSRNVGTVIYLFYQRTAKLIDLLGLIAGTCFRITKRGRESPISYILYYKYNSIVALEKCESIQYLQQKN